ncbi:hypothetical protein GQ602_000536 [Ophiocordyceps camponoti-floridani]|uniref:Uncharacterized protein n=1 Tax=Ophiocordyceps camponoti-floridani TaxID=2030778 RepID=A0A8H4QCL7_9HYPO|nr:hypothetical protein GQ602_000536 [Ophiocordyceps camponoti-floridani]
MSHDGIIQLEDKHNFTHWFKQIRAVANGIWLYVDPETTLDVNEPIKPEKTATDMEWEYWKITAQDYNAIEERKKELNDIILNTISPQLCREAARCRSPREKIQQIRKSLHLDGEEEKRLAREKYQAIVAKKGRRNWTSWAMEFERAFLDCKDVNVEGYNDAKARRDFIKCLCASSVPWVASCGVSFSVTDEMTKEEDRASLEEFVRIFRVTADRRFQTMES